MTIPSLSLESSHVASSYLGAHDRLPDTYGRRLTLVSFALVEVILTQIPVR